MAWLHWRAFWRSPAVFIMFAMVTGSLSVVNLLELPFARSLVDCPTTGAHPGEFSGSYFCDDRKHVISQGQRFSSRAQSLEHCSRLVGLLMTALLADRYGRRPVLLWGAICVLLSTSALRLASVHRSLAVPLFIIAQGLQGMVDFDLLGEIVCGDLANAGADTQSVFTVMKLLTGTAKFWGGLLGVHFQVHEILDFQEVWRAVLVSGCGLLLVALFISETMPLKNGSSTPPQGVWESLRQEVTEYRDMLESQSFIRHLCLRNLASGLGNTKSIDSSYIMGIHGLSQKESTLAFLPLYPWAIFWYFLGPFLIRLIGERRAYSGAVLWVQGLVFVCIPWLPVSMNGFLTFVYLASTTTGINGLESAMMHEIVKERHRAKSKALWSLLNTAISPVPLCLYAQLFDAKASTYFRKGLPYFVSAIFSTTGFILFWVLLSPVLLTCADKLQEDRLELERGDAATAGKSSWSKWCWAVGSYLLLFKLTGNPVLGLVAASIAYWRSQRSEQRLHKGA